jgi:hypothetical protein
MIKKRKGDIPQIAGITLVACGILYEIAFSAPFGYLLITIGSFAFAIGTKIKHKRSK